MFVKNTVLFLIMIWFMKTLIFMQTNIRLIKNEYII